ncbi:hypothetical protein NDA13_004252 [Ustilago tritici]|nr:hypothetical protein NDA13_004252 [Ustilago tritici]
MAASTSSSLHGHGDTTLSPSATTSFAGSSTLYSSSSVAHHHPAVPTSATSLSGTDHLCDVFNKRIRSLVYLKRSLQGQRTWLQTIQLDPAELASAFDNDRMHKRTLRYFLLGLSLSSILEISKPSDMARAIVSLINELDSYTDDSILSLTSGSAAASFGAQRTKMRSFFKTGRQTLKRSTAAQAISEFGTLDSSIGPASTLAANEQNSYLMAPNIPFQLDFFRTFFTLCDMLTEIYYKMLSFLPRDATAGYNSYPEAGPSGTFGRASSPPISASDSTSNEFDPNGSISQAFSAAGLDVHNETSSDNKTFLPASNTSAPVISGITQELLLKADAKIKKTIHAQVKDIDVLARQLIKNELSSLGPLLKDLGLDTTGGSTGSNFPPSSSTVGAWSVTTKDSSISSGLPASSTSSLPSGFSQSSSTLHSTLPSNTSGGSKLSSFVTNSSLPSHFRRQQQPPPPRDPRTSQDSHHHGHHQFNLATIPNDPNARAEAENGAGGGIGSLIRSRSDKLRKVMGTDRPPSSGGQRETPTSEGTSSISSPTKE